MTLVKKQDSNSTGLRYCEEASLGVLPATADQVWYPAEPNSYSDFGGQIKTVARNPINASRQNQKGVTVDLDASGGWNSDLTKTNLLRLLRGFMFADMREPFDTQSYDNGQGAVTAVTNATSKYSVGRSVTGVLANMLLLAEDFSNSANNGVKHVASTDAAVAATGTLTFTAGAIADDKVEIDGVYYVFASSVASPGDGSSATPHKVKVGVDDAASLTNLANAINAAGTAGTDYEAGLLAHSTVTSTSHDGTHVVVAAKTAGDAGNSITTSVTVVSTDDGLAWGGANLSGGSDADIEVTETLTDETPSASARAQVVGYEFASATLDVDVSHTLPRLNRASGVFDFTTLPIIPGQWIFVGGDDAGKKFVTAENNGWARVRSVAAGYIELDKTTSTMVAETGTGLTVDIFFGKVLKNEHDPSLIVRHSFQLERDLGQYDTTVTDHQSEVLIGAVANEFTLNVKQADKINADMTFVATDNAQRTQADQMLSVLAVNGGGSAPGLVSEDAYNTSSHVARLRMTIPESDDANPTALFAYLTEFTIVVNNNVQPNKAVSVLGAFDLTAGQFDVSGKVTAYFADVAAVQAVRNNADVSLDFALARDNFGIVFDVPLVSLGDGRLNVEQNNPITLPLDMNAGADRTFNHTMSVGYFAYLPDAAM